MAGRLDDAGRAPERTPVATYGEPWRWMLAVAPPFDLKGENLAGYLRWVSRAAGLEVRFASPSLERMARETGIHADLPGLAPEETLDVVLPACGARRRFADGLLIVEFAAEG